MLQRLKMKIIMSGMESQNLLFFPPVLPGPDVIVCVRNTIDTVLLTIPANKNVSFGIDYDKRVFVHCYGRIVYKSDIPMFSRGRRKNNTQWVYWVYLIFHNHTRTLCHKLINLVGTMVQSLRSVWRQVKDTQAIEWKPYIIPYPKPNHIDEFTFKNFLNLVSPNRSCFTISR